MLTLHGAIFSVVAVLALAGCRAGGTRSVEQANDDLRRENLELIKQVETLTRDRDDLRVKLSQETQARVGALRDDVLAALPVCAGIEIDSLSGLEPARGGAAADKNAGEDSRPGSGPGLGPGAGSGRAGAGDDNAETKVVVYLRPFDGRNRFVQIVGTLTVEAAWLPPVSGGPAHAESLAEGPVPSDDHQDGKEPAGPRTIARMELSPEQLRDAYRGGFFGSYYVVEMPAGPGVVEPAHPEGTLVIRARFADALSGRVWKAERVRRR